MASDRQIAANRANAEKSTGPKTPDGKRRAAANARRHGLSARGRNPAQAAAAQALAEAICADEPHLDPAAALAAADALVRLEEIARISEELTDFATAQLDPSATPELRADLARLAILPRLRALHDYEARAAASLRKALRRL
jgi:hypothetical protein